jgi:cold-inducible RNA-binding protein
MVRTKNSKIQERLPTILKKPVLLTTRLFVGNLSKRATPQGLQELFNEIKVNAMNCKVIMDPKTGNPRGFGFADVTSENEALRAMDLLNGREFCGRPINVTLAKSET